MRKLKGFLQTVWKDVVETFAEAKRYWLPTLK